MEGRCRRQRISNLRFKISKWKHSTGRACPPGLLGLVCPFRAKACEGRGPRASPSANVGVAPSGRKQMGIYGALQHSAQADEFTILDFGLGSGRRRRDDPTGQRARGARPSRPEGRCWRQRISNLRFKISKWKHSTGRARPPDLPQGIR